MSAVGEATVAAATATADAVKKEILGSEGEVHVVLPDENIDSLAEKYGVSKRDLIRVNSLCRRSLRAGQELIIPIGDASGGGLGDGTVVHPNEILILKATNEHDQEGVIRFQLDNVIWSESGEEKYTINMENVKNVKMDLSHDLIPELLPATIGNGKSGSDPDSESAAKRVAETAEPESEMAKNNGAAHVVEFGETTATSASASASAVVGGGSGSSNNETSPEDLDDGVPVRVDFTLFCNEGLEVGEEEEEDSTTGSSSAEDDGNGNGDNLSVDQCEQKTTSGKSNFTKSFIFERSHVMPLANYLELWHAELVEMSPRLASIVARQKDMFFTTSAFTTFSPADLTPTFNGDATSDILQDTHLQQIFANLSPKIQNQPWTLAYSTQVNGFSLRNLYRECRGTSAGLDDSAVLRGGSVASGGLGRSLSKEAESEAGPCLIVIQSTESRIFGSFLTCYPTMTDNFVGTGKSWLFAFGGRKGQKLRIYKWSGVNEHFYRGTTDNIIIGADEGRFGISVDGDLHKGRVQECATFQNWPLPGLDEDFVIGCLEVWTFESIES